ncbi:HNH endonuclease [Caulobacter segnis]
MSVLRFVAGMSEDARIAYHVGISLCWEWDVWVHCHRLRSVSGLTKCRLAKAIRELEDDACVWRIGCDRIGFDGAPQLLRKSIGPQEPLSAKDWLALRQRVFKERGNFCTYCHGVDSLAVDHIVSLKLGGSNHFENLVRPASPATRRNPGAHGLTGTYK